MNPDVHRQRRLTQAYLHPLAAFRRSPARNIPVCIRTGKNALRIRTCPIIGFADTGTVTGTILHGMEPSV